MKKRVYKYDSFHKKIKEGVEEPGFIKEFEDEIESDIDELGEGEKITDDSPDDDFKEEESDFNEEKEEESENYNSLDMGNREDISTEEVKVKMGFVNDQIKSLNNLLKNSDDVPLDKPTKEKIIKLYRMLLGGS